MPLGKAGAWSTVLPFRSLSPTRFAVSTRRSPSPRPWRTRPSRPSVRAWDWASPSLRRRRSSSRSWRRRSRSRRSSVTRRSCISQDGPRSGTASWTFRSLPSGSVRSVRTSPSTSTTRRRILSTAAWQRPAMTWRGSASSARSAASAAPTSTTCTRGSLRGMPRANLRRRTRWSRSRWQPLRLSPRAALPRKPPLSTLLPNEQQRSPDALSVHNLCGRRDVWCSHLRNLQGRSRRASHYGRGWGTNDRGWLHSTWYRHARWEMVRVQRTGMVLSAFSVLRNGKLRLPFFFVSELRPGYRPKRDKLINKDMINIAKISQSVPIFGTTGANAREHKAIKFQDFKKSLEQSGVNFDTYTIYEGEILRFPKLEDMELEWVAIRKGSKRGYFIVKCESELNGRKKPTWFGLPALSKRAHFEGEDVENFNTPVNPTWYDLGNDYARLEALAKMGEIHGESKVEVFVPVFDDDGNRVMENKLDEDSNPILEDGKEVLVSKRKKQTVVVISEYAPAEDDEQATE